MGLRNATLDKSYYTVRTLIVDPKTRRFKYKWLPARYLSNWDALTWTQGLKGYTAGDLFEWSGQSNQWLLVPGVSIF